MRTCIFQDYEGSITNLNGQVCEKLLCVQVIDNEEKSISPGVFWLKIRDSKWHRFFIDSSSYFLSWNVHDEIDSGDLEDEDDFPVLDVGEKFGLNTSRIMSIEMNQIENSATDEGHLTIRFSNELTLKIRCGDTGSAFSVV